MRPKTIFVSLLAVLRLAGCAETTPYCPTADYSAACRDLNTRTGDRDAPQSEQPKPIEPDYDRRDNN